MTATATAAGPLAVSPVGPEDHVLILFGATGDLAKRKLLPGLFRLAAAGMMPERVWRLRSWSASGWAIITSDAAPSSPAASASPWATMIFARFSRSASASRAIARCMLSGSWMSLSSTTVTSTPHSSVWTSMISRMFWLILSGSESVLVERVAPDDGPECGLGDLVDGRGHVLDRHDRADRALNAVVGDGGDVDADVVAGDDPQGLDRHRDESVADPVNAIGQREDEDHAGPAAVVIDATQPEHQGPLVLLENRVRLQWSEV